MKFEWFVARRYLRSPYRPAVLRLVTAFPRLSRTKIIIDATRNAGAEIVATGRVSWEHGGEPRGATLEFTNEDPSALYEFRIHTRGRPLQSRLRFFGVRIELIGGSSARLKPSELHTGEQLSLLVDLPHDGRILPPTAQLLLLLRHHRWPIAGGAPLTLGFLRCPVELANFGFGPVEGFRHIRQIDVGVLFSCDSGDLFFLFLI